MESLFSSLLTFLLLYKYVALFVIAFSAAFLLPLPASTTLAAAGAFAAQGYFGITQVLVVGFIANVLGDLSGYLIAIYFEKELSDRQFFRKISGSKQYLMLSAYIREFPHSLIFMSRFLSQVGSVVNLLSGIAAVPKKTFIPLVLIGEASYVLLYAGVGYYLGSAWDDNLSLLVNGSMVLTALALIIAVIQIQLFKKRMKPVEAVMN